MSVSSTVMVGNQGPTIWVKVSGRGSFQTSPAVKDFIQKMMDRGSRDFVVDLQECELMDSTFMGTLAGVALRLRSLGSGTLKAVNVNQRNSSLLENLGLDQLFEVSSKPTASAPESLREAGQAGTESPDGQKEAVLEAHEALVQADPANAVKFKDVIEYLRQDLGEDTPEKA